MTAVNPNRVPLSQSQTGVYIESLQSDCSDLYHLPFLFRMPGSVSPEKFVKTVEKLIADVPEISARVVTDETGIPYLADFSSTDPVVPEVLNISEAELQTLEPSLVTPFTLDGSGPLAHFKVITTELATYFFVDIHHVIADGWSYNLLIHWLEKIYRGEELPKDRKTMFDLNRAEAEARKSPRYEAARNAYAEILSGFENGEGVRPDKDGKNQSYSSFVWKTGINEETYKNYCKKVHAPASVPATVVAGLTLCEFSRRDDVAFATIYHGRKEEDSHNAFGMMVKTMPVRVNAGSSTVGQLVDTTIEQVMTSRLNDIYSFADIVRDYSFTPDLLFAYQGTFLAWPPFLGEEIIPKEFPRVATGENISLELFINDGELELHCCHRSDLFSHELMKAMCQTYSTKLSAIIEKPESAKVSDLPVMPEEMKAEVAEFSQGGPSLANPDDTIPGLFIKTARRMPDKTAVVFEDRRLSYGEIDRITDALARKLRDDYGVKKGDFVGVMIDRSELMAIYPLAVMKAGAAYMPLDPHFPEDRLSFMTEDASLGIILEEDGLVASHLPSFKGKVFSSSGLASLAATDSTENESTPDSPMVVLYTSGSTGKPKGVVLTQRNIVNFCATYASLTGLTEDDITGAYAAFGFDAHMMDLYPSFQQGATVHIFSPTIRLDLTAMRDYINREKLSVMFMTTQIAWQMVTLFEFPGIRVFLGGGEKLPPLGKLPFKFLNLYGPTECSVFATAYSVESDTDGKIIGKPVAGYDVRIVDERLRDVPPGVPGELVILGDGVATGYLNRPDLTAEKFVTIDRQRAYRTGDQARFMPDGEIEFIGRLDGMVKLRGLRIELGEIEAVAARHPDVKAFVAAVKQLGGMDNLVGYYTTKDDADVTPDQLRDFMSQSLTEFMIPGAIMKLDVMPLTPNGKVDRRALPVPEIEIAEIVVPASEDEKRLFRIVSEVVGGSDFGVTTNLLSVGLTSLLAMRLVAAIARETGVKVSAKEVMSSPTVRQLAELVRGSETSARPAAPARRNRRKYYPLTENQRGVYIDWEMNRDALQYNIPRAFRMGKDVDPERLRLAILEVVKAHPGLMTRMTARNGDIMQEARDGEIPEIPVVELQQEPDAAFFQSLVRPFDLMNEPLFRAAIYTYGDNKYLMLDTHHIVFDGMSAMVFNSELVKAYEGKTLEPEEYSALEHSLYEKELLESDEADKAAQWFGELIESTEPTSYRKSEHPDSETAGQMGRATVKMPSQAIDDFCKKNGLTVSNYLLSTFLQLLHRLTREENLQITTVNNGRNDIRLLADTGMFVKTLPVISRCKTPEGSPLEFARRVQDQFLTTQDYDFYPFTQLVEKYGVRPEIMYVFEGGINLGGDDNLKMESIPLELNTAKVPLTLLVFEPAPGEYELVAEYDSSLYSRADMELLLRMMRSLSLSLLTAETIVGGSMIDEEQEKTLRTMRYGDSGEVPYHFFHQTMEMRCDATPDAPALVAKDKRMTYREFDDECNRIANALIRRGVVRGDKIVILLPRRSFLITAIYATMKTGAAYIPCDPEYPADRIRHITEDSDARFIITTPDRVELYPGKALDINELLQETDARRPAVEMDPEDLAYLIYTSGSTGRPKGVMIPHRAISNYQYGYYRDYYANSGIKVHMLIVTISFDASLVDLGGSLTSGHCLVLADEEECKDVGLLSALMLREKVDATDVTPSRLDAMLDFPEFAEAMKGVRLLNIGGEGFKRTLIEKIFATGFTGIALNEYGPTETTVGSNHKALYPDKPVTSGPPFYNESERIVDAWGGELPPGAVGELYILGRSVGKGYYNMPEKTAQAYVTFQGEHAYRTGDLAYWTPEGDVTILGRIDHQVKLRGLRIELGEIESTALLFDGIKMASADVKEVNGIQHLCLYFTAAGEIDKARLKEHLAGSLTEYMVPDCYTLMEEMPLTPNGKINRKALPLPDVEPLSPYVKPEGELENAIAELFGKILGNNHVGAIDDFFSIGGTSISAIKVVASLGAMGHMISYKNVFAARTPRGLARLIEGKTEEPEPQAPAEPAPSCGTARSEFADILDANTLKAFHDGESQPLGRVMLTGATGFMGIHMLRDLIVETDSQIICTLRSKGGVSAESRLRTLLFYYFDDTFEEAFASGRVKVAEADVTSPVPAELDGAADTIVNCAANVKHFSAGNDIEQVNVESVRHLVDYCLRNNARLVHVSTVSVAGESVNGCPDPDIMLTEHMLDFHQVLSNQYVHSKYMAEHIILTAIRDRGLNAKIMRVGNLSARGTDGEFQINFRSNAFMGRLRAYVAVGCVPFDALDAPCEFSPIDEVCRAILLLAATPREMVVFHPTNNHRLPLGDVIHILNETGLDVVPVEPEEFMVREHTALEDPSRVDALQPLLAYDSDSGT